MKTSSKAFLLAASVPLLVGIGCDRIRAKSVFRDGNKAYKEENYKKAIPLYERAVELNPEMAEAHFYLGSAHQALFRPGKDTPDNKEHLQVAIKDFEKSLEVNTAGSDALKKLKTNTLGALIGIYSEDPFKNYDLAKKYADMLVNENPNDPKNLFAMANLYEKFEKVAEAEGMYRKVVELNANDVKACGALAAFYNKALWDDQGNVWVEGSDRPRRARFDQAIGTLERCASLAPNDAGGFQKIATFYWDKAYRDPLLNDKQKDEYADKGLENVDKALKLKPDYFEAVIFKGLLYRVKAGVTTNPRLRQQYLDQAANLQKQGLELKKEQMAAAPSTAPASPPTPQ
jgi:tetratricopeptide (TPR) repeat protein